MTKITLFMIAFCCILSCGSNESSPGNDTGSSNQKNSSGKYGSWEQDSEGNKYREDYALRDMLSGYELVKYTRTDGGQFGGGSSTTRFTLCSDGSLQYYHQSLTTVSVEGAGGSDASEDDDQGTWKAIENEKGFKILMIKSTKYGTTGYMEIKPMDSKVNMVWHNEWQEFFMKKTGC